LRRLRDSNPGGG